MVGFTYNFENPHTKYQNGVDAHLDWGASYFLTKQFHFGAVGYYYQQLTGDSGTGAKLGPFKSRVAGIGPQLGYIFPVSDFGAGLLQREGLQGVRGQEPARWLERVADPLVFRRSA